MWKAVKDLLKPAVLTKPHADPLTLLAFGEGRESLQRWAKWKVLTDRSVGGYSEASFDIVDGGGATDGDKENSRPRAVFSGVLSTQLPNERIKQSGYCAVKLDFHQPILVAGRPRLELRIRTDGRVYTSNLQVTSFIPDELYQGYIKVPAGRWHTISLPFRDMTLTRLGKMAEVQRDIDGPFELESIGFLLADGVDGPFKLEIDSVRAVPEVRAGAAVAEDGRRDESAMT